MENRNIIIYMLVIIAILAVAFCMVFYDQSKDDSNLAIADKTINVGDQLVVKLTDSSGNPISNQTISIKITDNDGKVTDKQIKTNSKGKAKFTMEDKGNFSVECRFDGNDKYASSSISDNVKVKNAATKMVSEEKTSSSSSDSGLSGDGYSYYSNSGPAVDSRGVTREEAEANNMHYIPQRIDGRDAGVYVKYDSEAGSYHT